MKCGSEKAQLIPALCQSFNKTLMVIENSDLMSWDISDLRIHTGKKVNGAKKHHSKHRGFKCLLI